MPIPTSRTKENAIITLHPERCNGCGLCVSVCKDFSIELADKKVRLTDKPVFGCIACGHCMAICPQDAIEINGRTLSPSDLFPLPGKQEMTEYNALLSLLKHRRSIREFRDKAVEQELVTKILEAARQAPMGLPPSDVNVLILDGKEKVFEFSKDYCLTLEKMKWLFSGWFIALMRPFWGKETGDLFKGFLRPLYEIYTGGMKKNINYVMYDAPLAMYFYGSPFCDPVDPVIPATYAMLAAESLGLGTCMLGGIHPLIQNGSAAKKLREKYGIKGKSKEGIFVIFGYPSVKYQHGIMRTFASETVLRNIN
jgi:nitroreductase/NAD-dependent dihydropyrimidine dehydrogenase PreA subunit